MPPVDESHSEMVQDLTTFCDKLDAGIEKLQEEVMTFRTLIATRDIAERDKMIEHVTIPVSILEVAEAYCRQLENYWEPGGTLARAGADQVDYTELKGFAERLKRVIRQLRT